MELAKNGPLGAAGTDSLTLLFQSLFERIVSARRRLLLLDYDGTIASDRLDPENAKPHDGICEILDEILEAESSHIVVITHRPARELLPLLNLRHQPEIYGLNGWERLMPDGSYYSGPFDAAALRGLLQSSTWIQDLERLGARVKYTPCGATLLWHGLADDTIDQIRYRALEEWNSFGESSRLVWGDIEGGIEWRLSGRGKAYIVRTLLDEHFDAFAAYLGNDLTTEDAFSVLRGRGMGVLVRPQRRPTFADGWLQPPEQLLEFLTRWRAYCRVGYE